jgi:hypothetical protein
MAAINTSNCLPIFVGSFGRTQYEHMSLYMSSNSTGERTVNFLMVGKHHVTGEDEFWISYGMFDINALYYTGTGRPLSDIGYLKKF